MFSINSEYRGASTVMFSEMFSINSEYRGASTVMFSEMFSINSHVFSDVLRGHQQ